MSNVDIYIYINLCHVRKRIWVKVYDDIDSYCYH